MSGPGDERNQHEETRELMRDLSRQILEQVDGFMGAFEHGARNLAKGAHKLADDLLLYRRSSADHPHTSLDRGNGAGRNNNNINNNQRSPELHEGNGGSSNPVDLDDDQHDSRPEDHHEQTPSPRDARFDENTHTRSVPSLLRSRPGCGTNRNSHRSSPVDTPHSPLASSPVPSSSSRRLLAAQRSPTPLELARDPHRGLTPDRSSSLAGMTAANREAARNKTEYIKGVRKEVKETEHLRGGKKKPNFGYARTANYARPKQHWIREGYGMEMTNDGNEDRADSADEANRADGDAMADDEDHEVNTSLDMEGGGLPAPRQSPQQPPPTTNETSTRSRTREPTPPLKQRLRKPQPNKQ